MSSDKRYTEINQVSVENPSASEELHRKTYLPQVEQSSQMNKNEERSPVLERMQYLD